MDYLANDLSLAGQFPDVRSFFEAVERIMGIRQEILRAGASFWCHRKLRDAHVTASVPMRKAVQTMPPAKRSAWLQWIAQQGPYWEDERQHESEAWFEAQGDLVTESALAEAAYCVAHGLPRELVSFAPSAWLYTPIPVRWARGPDNTMELAVANHWTVETVRDSLAQNPVPLDSWSTLADRTRTGCPRLTFAQNAFMPLGGHPFVPSAAERIQVLLRTLDIFCGCFDEAGQRTAEGHRLYQDRFTGKRAWFTDSSDTEKNEFRNEMTFPCPDDPGRQLFCTWHGKVSTPPIRVHFSWPVRFGSPVYVVYVGPKITKR